MLKDKVILVTGGSRGIGKAVVIECTKLRAKVIFTFKEQNRLAQETAKKYRAQAIKCDVTSKDDVIDLFRIIKGKYGVLHGVVNNAGIIRDRSLFNMREQEWLDVITTNLSSLYYVTKPALGVLQKGGSIVNVSSMVGLQGNKGQTNYAAAKAGVIGFSKSLAKELEPRGIRVNVVAPGLIDTDMTKGLAGLKGNPVQVAKAVVFLLSDDASYINGQVIRVYKQRTAKP